MGFIVDEQRHQTKSLGRIISALCKQTEGNIKVLVFVNTDMTSVIAYLNSLIISMNELKMKFDVRDEKLMNVMRTGIKNIK